MSVTSRRSMLLYGASASVMAAMPVLAAQPTYKETTPPRNAGKISGRVFYRGNGTEVPVFPVVKDQHICGSKDRSPKALRYSEDTRTLGDVVIAIKGIDTGKPWQPIFSNGKIYQVDCSFQPYVQIIRSNAYVDIHNLDPIMHNIHAYEVHESARRSMFNFAQPKQGQVDRIDLNFRRGNILMIDCNAHNWMAAFVYTSPNPYFDVTGQNGEFEISDIPPGSYELSIWHPVLGEKNARLNVAADADLAFDINLE